MDKKETQYKASCNSGADKKKIIEKTVVVFILGYGLHYFGYFIRARYFNLLGPMALDEGLAHALEYLGHTIFFVILLLFPRRESGIRHCALHQRVPHRGSVCTELLLFWQSLVPDGSSHDVELYAGFRIRASGQRQTGRGVVPEHHGPGVELFL